MAIQIPLIFCLLPGAGFSKPFPALLHLLGFGRRVPGVARRRVDRGRSPSGFQAGRGKSVEGRKGEKGKPMKFKTGNTLSSHEAHKAKPAAKRLAAKIALITGGSRGIGAAIALRLAADGARIVISYKRNRAAADEVVAEIAEHCGVSSLVRSTSCYLTKTGQPLFL